MVLSIFYFNAGDKRLALRTVHELLNDLSLKHNAELYFTARFFYLILLIELDRSDYFEVAWLSTKRLLKNNNYQSGETEIMSQYFDSYNKLDKNGMPLSLPGIENENAIENPFFSFRNWVINKRKDNSNSNAIAS